MVTMLIINNIGGYKVVTKWLQIGKSGYKLDNQ